MNELKKEQFRKERTAKEDRDLGLRLAFALVIALRRRNDQDFWNQPENTNIAVIARLQFAAIVIASALVAVPGIGPFVSTSLLTVLCASSFTMFLAPRIFSFSHALFGNPPNLRNDRGEISVRYIAANFLATTLVSLAFIAALVPSAAIAFGLTAASTGVTASAAVGGVLWALKNALVGIFIAATALSAGFIHSFLQVVKEARMTDQERPSLAAKPSPEPQIDLPFNQKEKYSFFSPVKNLMRSLFPSRIENAARNAAKSKDDQIGNNSL